MTTQEHRPLPDPAEEIDVLIVLNYYSPHISGLTNVARDVAEFLASRGLRVTVVTTQHDDSLPRHEIKNGVFIRRSRVIGSIDRAPISPGFVRDAVRCARKARMVNLHLPMPEAGAIAAVLPRATPLVVTYQCDPPTGLGLKSDAVAKALDISHGVAIKRASRVVVSSHDYASASRLLAALPTDRVVAVPPQAWPRLGGSPRFRSSAASKLSSNTHFGFLGRLTSEKGADVLIRAFRRVAGTDERLLVAGEGVNVAGDSSLSSAVAAADGDPRVVFLGRLTDEELADFYASIDVFCLPSTNSFEAFGIVQVEALLAGIPVVASDLPGVRTPIVETDGGLLVEPGSEESLSEALANPLLRSIGGSDVAARAERVYNAETALTPYEAMFRELVAPSVAASEIPDTYAAAYYEANEQDGDRIALRWYAALLKRYAEPGRALDFGCGTGWLVKRLLRQGSADGLEQSEYALAQARENNPAATFYSASSEIPGGRYSALACIHVVEHVPESELSALLAEWRRILKPGGVALVVTPDQGGRGSDIRGDAWRGYDDPTHITLRSHVYWRELLVSSGFEIVTEGSDGLWDPPYGSWVVDRARLVPIATQVLTGRIFEPPGSGESAVIVARRR